MNKERWNELQKYFYLFSELDLDLSYLFITETAMKKSIIDATIPFKNFLKNHNLHDYDSQGKGNKEHGKKIPTLMLLEDSEIELESSVYRPKTKDGDPRIWFRGIKKYYNSEAFIAVTTDGEKLYILNLSDKAIRNSLDAKSRTYNVLFDLSKNQESNARELYQKIKEIHNKGFIKTIKAGDTGVGMTLEHLLNIRPNADKGPDYKGIELKTSRNQPKKPKTRTTLYSRVPTWNKNFKGSKDLIDNFGYWSEEKQRRQLYCTISAKKANPQGLYLISDEKNDCLWVAHKEKGKVVEWEFKKLREQLMEKHHETFWVEAETKEIDGIEHFKYNKVTYTKNPNIELIPLLFDNGIITLDFTMHIKPNGNARDHGYLMKIDEKNLELLFPKPKEYNLETDSFDDF